MPDIETEAKEHLAKLEEAKELVEDDIFDLRGDVAQALEDVNYAQRNRDDWSSEAEYETYLRGARDRLKSNRSRLAEKENKKKEIDDLILKIMDVARHAKLRRN